jgi:polar amino acid transport system substrate-binding protein
VVHCKRFNLTRACFATLVAATAACASIFTLPLIAIAADLPTIQKRGRLIVAVKDNSPPLGFRSAEGSLQGLEIDIAQRIAQELLGRPDAVDLRPVLNQDRFAAVLNNKVDIAIARVTLTPSRLRILRFSIPYYTDGAAILVQDSSLRSLSALNGKAIAVLNGSQTIEALRRHVPTAILVGVRSYADAKAQLDNGSVVGVAADASILSGWKHQSPQYHLLSTKLSTELLCVVLPKGRQYEDLREQIDQILARLKATGWLEERIKHWGLPL